MSKILINSVNRSVGQTSSNFTVTLSENVEGMFTLLGIEMFNTLGNVLTGLNDSVPTSLGTVTITAGYYDPYSFCTELQTRLRTLDASFTVTYSVTTSKITTTCNTAFSFNWSTGSNTAAMLLGYDRLVSTNAGTSQVSTYPINLTYTRGLIVDIAEAVGDTFITTGVSSVGQLYIPLNVHFGGLVDLSHGKFANQTVQLRRTSRLTIRLYAENGEPVSIGSDWTMLLVG